ncbi:hypothetical protein F01_110001 [Burkholderia cenocepacia]|nr:hypothetical protein F01_110001 [Burkholderia cenocepacia]
MCDPLCWRWHREVMRYRAPFFWLLFFGKTKKSDRWGLSGILCLRHNMLPRRIYASQTESPAGGSAGDSGRVA